MYTIRRLARWGGPIAVLVGVVVFVLTRPRDETFITGAVVAADSDLNKQRPIAQALIQVVAGASSGQTMSDAAGFYRVRLTPRVVPGQEVTIRAGHRDYRPFEETTSDPNQIHLVRLVPLAADPSGPSVTPTITIGNVRVRYALKSSSAVEVGSVTRTFQVENAPNVPCNNREPCSPDGKWKATLGSFSLDAGENKQFRNARVSCLAGPCPFTRIDSDGFSRGGRVISGAILNWGDTVTYLVEGEVVQTMVSDLIRHSYPMIFGRTMSFTLPPSAQGPSIEAEVDGTAIVFPLGPKLLLSWATCRLETGSDQTRLHRCGGVSFFFSLLPSPPHDSHASWRMRATAPAKRCHCSVSSASCLRPFLVS
jgi:hypothetical protein